MTRGNITYDQMRFGDPTQFECENTGVQGLCAAFERVLARPRRPVPKLGRPPLSDEQKLKNKLEREFKKTKQLAINPKGKAVIYDHPAYPNLGVVKEEDKL